jgi:general secretion pathway protein G
MKSRQGKLGFTLIEVLVVLLILGLLAGLVGPRLFGKVDTSKVKTAETQVKMLKTALQTFRLDVGRYPSTEEGLAALEKRPEGDAIPAWSGPYLDESLPADPWGNPFQYRDEPGGGQDFTLYSFGADGKAGGDGVNADIGYQP